VAFDGDKGRNSIGTNVTGGGLAEKIAQTVFLLSEAQLKNATLTPLPKIRKQMQTFHSASVLDFTFVTFLQSCNFQVLLNDRANACSGSNLIA
jgi:hypothetical protein